MVLVNETPPTNEAADYEADAIKLSEESGTTFKNPASRNYNTLTLTPLASDGSPQKFSRGGNNTRKKNFPPSLNNQDQQKRKKGLVKSPGGRKEPRDSWDRIATFIRHKENYENVYFEELTCIEFPAWRLRTTLGDLMRELDSFKWRGFVADALEKLHYSDLIEGTDYPDAGRMREVRFSGIMQDLLMGISMGLAKMQKALNQLWHKLSLRPLSPKPLNPPTKVEILRQGQPARPGSPDNFRQNRGKGTKHEADKIAKEEAEKLRKLGGAKTGDSSASNSPTKKRPKRTRPGRAGGPQSPIGSPKGGSKAENPETPTAGNAGVNADSSKNGENGTSPKSPNGSPSAPSSPESPVFDPKDPKWQNSETLIKFLKCMMAPTRNSVSSLQRELRKLQDEWRDYTQRMDLRMQDLGKLMAKRKLLKLIKRWFEEEGTNAKVRIAINRATTLLQKANLRKMRAVTLKEWWGCATKERLERKIDNLENTVKKQYQELAKLQLQLLKAEDMEDQYMEVQAEMIRKKLREMILRKCFTALSNHARQQILRALHNKIDQLASEKKALDDELTQKHDQLLQTTTMLQKESHKCASLFTKTTNVLQHLSKDWFLHDYFREWRRIVSVQVSKKFKETDRLRVQAELGQKAAEQKRDMWEKMLKENEELMTAQRTRLNELEVEKTTIAEHFSEALKIAQGGRCLPPLPSAFLCRKCNGELVTDVRGVRDEYLLDKLALQGSPRADIGVGKVNLSSIAMAGVGKRKSYLGSRSPSRSPGGRSRSPGRSPGGRGGSPGRAFEESSRSPNGNRGMKTRGRGGFEELGRVHEVHVDEAGEMSGLGETSDLGEGLGLGENENDIVVQDLDGSVSPDKRDRKVTVRAGEGEG